MLNLRLLAVSTLAATSLVASTAQAAPPTTSKVPAPFAGCTYVRGVTAEDQHENNLGKGHHLHGNGWGYGHGCGDNGDGGGDTGGGDTLVS